MAQNTEEFERLIAEMQKVTGSLTKLSDHFSRTPKQNSGTARNKATNFDKIGSASLTVERDFTTAGSAAKALGAQMASTGKTMRTANGLLVSGTQKLVKTMHTGVEGAISGFSRSLEKGILGAFGGGAIAALLEGGWELSKTYKEMNDIGQTFSGSMLDMAAQAGAAGMPLERFTAMLERNSAVSVVLADSSTQTGKSLGALQASVRENLKVNGFYNMSVDQISNLTSDYAETIRLTGSAQLRNKDAMTAGITSFAKDINDFSQVTGKNRDEIANATKTALRDVGFAATDLTEKQREAIVRATTMLASLPGATGDTLSKMLTQSVASGSAYMTDEGKKLASGGFTQILGIMDNLREKSLSGQASPADMDNTVKDLQAYYAQNKDMLKTQRVMGNQTASELLEMLESIQGLDGKRFLEMQKQQALTKTFSTIMSDFNTLTGAFRDGFYTALKPIETAFNGFANDPAFAKVKETLTQLGATLGEMVASAFTHDNMMALRDGLNWIASTGMPAFVEAVKFIGRIVRDDLAPAFAMVVAGLRDELPKVITWFTENISPKLRFLFDSLNTLNGGFKPLLLAIEGFVAYLAIKKGASLLGSFFSNIFGMAFRSVAIKAGTVTLAGAAGRGGLLGGLLGGGPGGRGGGLGGAVQCCCEGGMGGSGPGSEDEARRQRAKTAASEEERRRRAMTHDEHGNPRSRAGRMGYRYARGAAGRSGIMGKAAGVIDMLAGEGSTLRRLGGAMGGIIGRVGRLAAKAGVVVGTISLLAGGSLHLIPEMMGMVSLLLPKGGKAGAGEPEAHKPAPVHEPAPEPAHSKVEEKPKPVHEPAPEPAHPKVEEEPEPVHKPAEPAHPKVEEKPEPAEPAHPKVEEKPEPAEPAHPKMEEKPEPIEPAHPKAEEKPEPAKPTPEPHEPAPEPARPSGAAVKTAEEVAAAAEEAAKPVGMIGKTMKLMTGPLGKAAKLVPFLGAAAEAVSARDRFKNGDVTGAALDGISAGLQLLGPFTAGLTSLSADMIQGYMFARDEIGTERNDAAVAAPGNAISGIVKGIGHLFGIGSNDPAKPPPATPKPEEPKPPVEPEGPLKNGEFRWQRDTPATPTPDPDQQVPDPTPAKPATPKLLPDQQMPDPTPAKPATPKLPPDQQMPDPIQPAAPATPTPTPDQEIPDPIKPATPNTPDQKMPDSTKGLMTWDDTTQQQQQDDPNNPLASNQRPGSATGPNDVATLIKLQTENNRLIEAMLQVQQVTGRNQTDLQRRSVQAQEMTASALA